MPLDFDDWESDLLSRIEDGLKFGKSLGADSLEIYLTKSRSLNVKLKGSMIDATQGGNIGVGCRCLTGKKVGFATASGITEEAINFAVESALKISKVLPKEDDCWKSFVQTSDIGKNGKIETSVLEIESEEIVKGANLIFNEAKNYDSRVSSFEGMISVGYGAFAIGNTEGLAKSSKTTKGEIEIYVIAAENSKNKTGTSFVIGRGVPKFENIGKQGAEKAVKLLNSKPFDKTAQMNVILNNLAAANFINRALINSVNGQSVIEGRSIFAEKIGEKVGTLSLTIIDDGQMPEDPNMLAIDDEGYPRKSTQILDKGILKSFIFDQYYSSIYSTKSTGNAKRRGPQTYESLPKIAPNTIYVVPGNRSRTELASDINSGILVEDVLLGFHTADVVSGDFSILAPYCYRIENGEITAPLEPVSVAGNLYKAFNLIVALGNETELTPFGKVPSIAFKGFTVTG